MRINDEHESKENNSSHHESRRRMRRSKSDDTMRHSDHASSSRRHTKRYGSTDALRKSSNHGRRPLSRKNSDDSMNEGLSDDSFHGDSSEHGLRKNSKHGRIAPSRRASNDPMNRSSDGSSDGLRKSSCHGRKGPSRRSSINRSSRGDEYGISSSSHHGSRRQTMDHSSRRPSMDHFSRRSRNDRQYHRSEEHRSVKRHGSSHGLLPENPRDSDKMKRRGSARGLLAESRRDSDRCLPNDADSRRRRNSLRNVMGVEDEPRHEKPRRRGSQRNLFVSHDEVAERPRRLGSQRNLTVDDGQAEKPRRRNSQRNLRVDDDTPAEQPRRRGSQRNLVSNEEVAMDRPRRRGSQRNLMRNGSKRGLLVDSSDGKPRRRGSQRALAVDDEADTRPGDSGVRRQGSSRRLKTEKDQSHGKRRGSVRGLMVEPENGTPNTSQDRFSDGSGRSGESPTSTMAMPQRRGSNKAARGVPSNNPAGAIVNEDYESMRARIAARFTSSNDTNANTTAGKEIGGECNETPPKVPTDEREDSVLDDYNDALAKVVERFSSENTRSSGKVQARRRSSRKVQQDGSSQGRLNSERTLSIIPDFQIQKLDTTGTTNEDTQAKTPDDADTSTPPRRELSRQSSDDSLDLDMIIAETIHDEIESEKKDGGRKITNLEDSVRVLERQHSDGSMGKKLKNDPQRGRLRRTTSADQTVDFFPDISGLKPKEEATTNLPDPEPVKKKIKKSVSFKEDRGAKRGVALKIIESEGPISPEEKLAGWFSGRDYKAFKQMCYSEATEAKENRDLRRHFERAWKACSSDSIDFAWQEIMNAEHKKNAPNSAVVMAKARSRGYERDTYPETLLRNRLMVIRAIVKEYENSVLSMTLSPEDQAEAVRKASQKLTQPFRRFARLMAEGDSLLVMAWERVSAKKKKKKQESGTLDDGGLGDSSHHTYTIPAVADRREQLRSQGRQEDSRRALLESSASCRRLLDDNKGSRREHLLDTRGIDSRRALLESSGSCRKLLESSNGSRRDHLLDTRGIDSRRGLLESSLSCRKLLDSNKGSRRDHLLDTRGIDSRRALLESSASSSRLMSGEDKKKRDLMERSSSQERLLGDDGSVTGKSSRETLERLKSKYDRNQENERPESMDDSENTFARNSQDESLNESFGADSQGYICHYLKNKRDDSGSDSEESTEPNTPSRQRRLGVQRQGSSKRLLVATPSQRRKASIKVSAGA